MKKLVALFLALVLCISLCACGKSGPANENSNLSGGSSAAFVKPENYASVLLVTINPQIKLYLDKDNKVLAVEPVNDDAKAVVEKLDIKNKKVDSAVESIISVSNEKGFVKENAQVKFEVAEKKLDTVDETAILSVAKRTAQKTATDLKISVSVNQGPSFTVNDFQNNDPINNITSQKPNINDQPVSNFTSVKNKVGKWTIRYTNLGKLYDFRLILYGNSENWWAKATIGDHFSTIPEEAWADIRTAPEYAEFKGEEYYMASGGGRPIVNFVERGDELTMTDANGDTLSLKRIDENKFLIGKSSPNFADLGRLPVGKTIEFVAD